ncbi:MAG: DUF4395 domain-containing protein [Candidatus Woesearchaeota archaeon]
MKNIKKIFYFGEKVRGYDVPVLNEREARAGAGIMFLFASIAFFNALLLANFYYIKLVVIAFLIDFFIRVMVNPKYAPSLIIGRLIVSNQKPEYTGAPQKRFAWSIGLVLATIMFYFIVLQNLRGPINLAICLLCLTLLFFETAFGICIGCKMYNFFTKKSAKHCPGGVCELNVKEPIQKTNFIQIIVALVVIGLLIAIHYFRIL